VASGDIWRTLRVSAGSLWQIAISPDCKFVAAVGASGEICVWDFASGVLRWKQRDPMHEALSLTFAADSKTLIVGGRERKNFFGELRRFNISSGKEQSAWHTKEYWEARRMTLSPDGSTLALSGDRNEIWLLDAKSDVIIKRLKGHSDRVESLAWSPDGSILLSGSSDSSARLWDVATGQLVRTWTAVSGNVTHVAFSPDGDEVFMLSGDGIRVWSMHDGRALRSFGDIAASCMVLSPDGKMFALASATEDHNVPPRLGLFNSTDGKVLRVWQGYRDEVNFVGFQQTVAGMRFLSGHGVITGEGDASEGTRIAMTDKSTGKIRPWEPQAFGVARVWNPKSGRLQSVIRDGTDKVNDVYLSHDTQRVLTCRYDEPVWWNTTTGKLLKTLVGHTHAIYALAVSVDGSTLATGGFDEKVRIWDLKTNKVRRVLPGKGTFGMPTALDWAHDGKVIFAGYSEGNEGGDNGVLCAWDVKSGKPLWKQAAHNDEIWQVVVSSNGKHLASASNDGELQKRDVQTGKLLWRIRAHTVTDQTDVAALAWSPDGSTLATGGHDALVKIWDACNGRLLHTLQGHGALINSVAFSPDGKVLISSSDDGTIRFWDARSGAWRGALRTLPGTTNSWIAWTSDGWYDGSMGVERFIRWNNGTQILPANTFNNRRVGALALLLGAQ
jgi:WD40 repeat protein